MRTRAARRRVRLAGHDDNLINDGCLSMQNKSILNSRAHLTFSRAPNGFRLSCSRKLVRFVRPLVFHPFPGSAFCPTRLISHPGSIVRALLDLIRLVERSASMCEWRPSCGRSPGRPERRKWRHRAAPTAAARKRPRAPRSLKERGSATAGAGQVDLRRAVRSVLPLHAHLVVK